MIVLACWFKARGIDGVLCFVLYFVLDWRKALTFAVWYGQFLTYLWVQRITPMVYRSAGSIFGSHTNDPAKDQLN